MPAEVDNLIRSPYGEQGYEIPDVPLMEYVFGRLREGLKTTIPKDKPWIVEIPSERKILLSEVEPNARKIASALNRLGMKKGQFTYFVTHELAQLFQVQMAIYLTGGCVRGCHPAEEISVYSAQMNHVQPKFVIVDKLTVDKVKTALKEYEQDVQMISVGEEKVPGTVHYTELLQDDGKAFPKDLKINPATDVANVMNTSGSTGNPKGVVHTQRSILSAAISLEGIIGIQDTLMEFMCNYGVIANCILMYNLCLGVTTFHYTNFTQDKLAENLLKYKPSSIILYPYVATWLSKQKELLEQMREMDFMKTMLVGGWVLDTQAADTLSEALPNAHIKSIYGMTETFCVAMTKGRVGIDEPAKVIRCQNDGKIIASSGNMLPNAVAKVVDLTTRKPLGPNEQGELMIKSPTLMSGYYQGPNKPYNTTEFDEEGFLKTGDLSFYDKDKNIYVLERITFVYKHHCHWVSPADVESVLLQHPDVLQVGVVNMPDPLVENKNRAYVVKRPGSKCTEQDLVSHVAEQTPFFKHIHNGVIFLDALPTNLAGKMDRNALKRIALAEAS